MTNKAYQRFVQLGLATIRLLRNLLRSALL